MLNRPKNWTKHAWHQFKERYREKDFTQEYLDYIQAIIEYQFRPMFDTRKYAIQEWGSVDVTIDLLGYPKIGVCYSYRDRCVVTCLPKNRGKKQLPRLEIKEIL